MPSTETTQPTPATEIGPGSPVAIYAFFWEAGSGGVYIGKHEHPEAQQWPESGEGRLPSGYGGSGKVIQAARRVHGDSAFRWRLLEVVPAGMDWEAAERRWVAWGREQHGERCRNLANGGEGLDSETMRELWECPQRRQRVSEASREQWKDPEYRERISEAVRAQWQDPNYRERLSEARRTRWQDPEHRKRIQDVLRNPEYRERISEERREMWKDPEHRERVSSAIRTQWQDPETRAAFHRGTLKKRLSAAQRRRDAQQPPQPLDNLCLNTFGQPLNPLPPLEPQEPPEGTAQSDVLKALPLQPAGLTAPELCAATGRPEQGARSVRQALSDLRKRSYQPIINEGGRFRLLRDEEWRVATD